MQARHLQVVIASSTSHTATQSAQSLPVEDQMYKQQRLRNIQASDSIQQAGRQKLVQHLQADQKPFTAAHLAHGSKRRRLDYASGHRAPQVLTPSAGRSCQYGLASVDCPCCCKGLLACTRLPCPCT